MKQCSVCKKNLGFFKKFNAEFCSKDDCNFVECSSCEGKKMKICAVCEGLYCPTHLSEKNHACQIESESEDDGRVSYYGKNKEYCTIEQGSYDYDEELFNEILKAEEKGYELITCNEDNYILRRKEQ